MSIWQNHSIRTGYYMRINHGGSFHRLLNRLFRFKVGALPANIPAILHPGKGDFFHGAALQVIAATYLGG